MFPRKIFLVISGLSPVTEVQLKISQTAEQSVRAGCGLPARCSGQFDSGILILHFISFYDFLFMATSMDVDIFDVFVSF